MPKQLVFLHTAPSHVATFERLRAELAPAINTRHHIDEQLLIDARAAGAITPALVQMITALLRGFADSGAQAVLCTCSTIGAAAEAAAPPGLTVLRVDRPMATHAVTIGHRILVAATLASTLGPTRELLQEEADRAGRQVRIEELLIEAAWAHFTAGDQQSYLETIAQALRNAPPTDVIVLAQASMAAATAHCPDLDVPILSSPRLGFLAMVEMLG
jgi:hypothetical protein